MMEVSTVGLLDPFALVANPFGYGSIKSSEKATG